MSFILKWEQQSMSNRLINNFVKLVSVYSPSGNELEFSDLLINLLKKYGSPHKDKYGNILIRKEGTGKPLFLSAHMDTVEPGKNIKPRINGNYIVSDGTTILGADNKAAIACILEFLELLKNKKTPHRTVEVIFTRSEEIGNYGAVNFDYSLLRAKEGFCFDSNAPVGTIITASPYYERFDLEIIGKSAHAASPSEAINVLFVFKELLCKVKPGFQDSETIINLGVIQGGYVRNTIPGNLFLAGEIRSFSEKKLIKNKNRVKKILNSVSKKFKSKYKIEFVRENPGYKFTNVPINQLIDTVKQRMLLCNIKPRLTVSWGVSDANIFNQKGLNCINLGDGVENAHTVKESVKINEMKKNANLIYNLVREI